MTGLNAAMLVVALLLVVVRCVLWLWSRRLDAQRGRLDRDMVRLVCERRRLKAEERMLRTALWSLRHSRNARRRT